MIYVPPKYADKKKIIAPWEYFKQLEGELDDTTAKVSLAKFLRCNLGYTVELLTGMKLHSFQEIILKGMLNRNFNLCVFSRGIGKTTLAGIYCFLQCIFEPGTKILVAGPTFRTARLILSALRDLTQRKEAQLLAQCFGKAQWTPDEWKWSINGGSITAIPLSGEKVRGYRANVLVIDEYLLMPKDIIDNVLMPFLVSPQDQAERKTIQDREDELIKKGLMKESERKVFEDKAKLIGLSSASYTFQNLYHTYTDFKEKIMDEKIKTTGTYFVSQMSWDSVPRIMISQNIIEQAENGGSSNASFQREYGAQFTDGSDSYFSMKKMLKQSLLPGEEPSILLRGNPTKKYVLGIDPNLSNSSNADDFAMCLLELDEQAQDAVVVHQYACAGADMKQNIDYLYYLMTHFNIVMIIIDNMGHQFIESANASETFTHGNIKLNYLEWNTIAENEDFIKEMARVKGDYNALSNKIVVKQYFTTEFISKANSYLQASIDAGWIWFGSPANGVDFTLGKLLNSQIALELTGQGNKQELIDEQDDLLIRTRNQASLIEFTATSRGTESFDLPKHLKRGSGETRARRDSYSAFLLANWAKKCYFDMINYKTAPKEKNTFTPFII